jgi:transcriptional regulator
MKTPQWSTTMYLPKAFAVEEQQALFAWMEAHNFATLVTVEDGVPFATHLPLMLDRTRGAQGTLVAHLARANPQWKHFANGQAVLVIFQGPHAYVSPSWYTGDFAVPTWNYIAVHAYGTPCIVDDEATLRQMLTELVANHESPRPEPWGFDWTERHLNLLKGIVAFTIEITRLEGKAKMSQNRSVADQLGVIHNLEQAADPVERQVAVHMAANLPANGR